MHLVSELTRDEHEERERPANHRAPRSGVGHPTTGEMSRPSASKDQQVTGATQRSPEIGRIITITTQTTAMRRDRPVSLPRRANLRHEKSLVRHKQCSYTAILRSCDTKDRSAGLEECRCNTITGEASQITSDRTQRSGERTLRTGVLRPITGGSCPNTSI